MKIPLVRFAAFLLPLLAGAQTPSTRAGQALAPDLSANPAAEIRVLDPKLPSLFIAGDSTAAKNNGNPTQGWAVPFADYFDPAKLNVVNLARGGRSTRTFIAEGLWDQLLAQVKAGDTVLIQFGHNDGSPVNEDASVPPERRRSRGTIPSLGEETQEIDNIITGKHEVVHTFGWYIRKMIADVKAKQATPIILSLTVRNNWKDGKVERGSGNYRRLDRELAAQAGIAFVDVTRIVADQYQAMGPDKVKALFGTDHTHTNVAGADLNAAAVVAGLKGIRKGPFNDWLSAKGQAVESDPVGWLNLPEPAEAGLPSLFLIGDSTVRNGGGDGAGGQWGWGDYLGAHFDPAKINIVNRAIGGLTARTFLNQGHWERALMLMKPGDFLVIQFGTNDGGPINEDASVPSERRRARGSLPGTGEETEEIDNVLTKKHEVVHTNGWYLRKFVREARAAGVTPVLCSLVPRKIWKDGKIGRSVNSSAAWAREVAEQEGVAFIDLNNLVAARYEELGEAKVNELFADEHTHTSRAGAEINAAIVAAALRGLPGDPFGAFAK
jgi:lysophospholipase L1-like esterase